MMSGGRTWLRGVALVVIGTVFGVFMNAPLAHSRHTPTPTPTMTPTPTPTPEAKLWNFDSDKAHQVANGWTDVEGGWEVIPDPSAPSAPNTLGLSSGRLIKSLIKALNYYPMAIVSDPTEYDDFTLEASFKTAGGRLDCSGGLIFRYVDPKNYYVVSAGCPNDYFAISRMTNGQLETLKQVVVPTDKGTWYQLKVVAKGDSFVATYGDKTLDTNDGKIRKGRIGLWAVADSQARFDNFKLTLPLKSEAPSGSLPGIGGAPTSPSEPGGGGLPSLPPMPH